MTTYIHDGVAFDLDLRYVDVIGIEWHWTGRYNEAGEPILSTAGGEASLPEVYHDHGPLIPMPARQSKTQNLDFARSLQDGHVESYEQYAVRTTQAAS